MQYSSFPRPLNPKALNPKALQVLEHVVSLVASAAQGFRGSGFRV